LAGIPAGLYKEAVFTMAEAVLLLLIAVKTEVGKTSEVGIVYCACLTAEDTERAIID